jgi:hypothetical protein
LTGIKTEARSRRRPSAQEPALEGMNVIRVILSVVPTVVFIAAAAYAVHVGEGNLVVTLVGIPMGMICFYSKIGFSSGIGWALAIISYIFLSFAAVYASSLERIRWKVLLLGVMILMILFNVKGCQWLAEGLSHVQ